jgi:hypothetical protein
MKNSSILWYPGSGTDLLPAFIIKHLISSSESPEKELTPLLCDLDNEIHQLIISLLKVEDSRLFHQSLQNKLSTMYSSVWSQFGFSHFTNEVEGETFTFLNDVLRSQIEKEQAALAYYSESYKLPDWDLAKITVHAVVEQKGKTKTVPIHFIFCPYASSICYEHIIKPQEFKVSQIALIRHRTYRNIENKYPLMPKQLLETIIKEQASFTGIWTDSRPRNPSTGHFSSVKGSYLNGWGLVKSSSPSDRYAQFFKYLNKQD